MAKQELNFTEFGETTVFDGELTFTDRLVISGKFTGTIRSTGDLEISKTSECNVDKITAKSVVVYGSVSGDINGQERVELCKGSSVKGNLTTENIRIADNVNFDGSISMLEDTHPSDVDLFSVSSDEFRKALILKNPHDN